MREMDRAELARMAWPTPDRALADDRGDGHGAADRVIERNEQTTRALRSAALERASIAERDPLF